MKVPLGCRRARAHATLVVRSLEKDLVVDGNVVLQRIPGDRLGKVQSNLRDAYGDSYRWLAQCELIRDYDCPATTVEEFDAHSTPVKRQLNEILAALRLLRVGKVEFDGLSFRALANDVHALVKGGPVFGGVLIEPRGEIHGLPDYRLKEADISEVERLLPKVRRCKLVDRFFFQRFMRSYNEPAVDRIVDCTICLESLLCPEKAAEIRYRFRMRGAAILAAQPERRRLFDVLGVIYDLRSAIVHGTFSESSKDSRKLLKSMEADSLWGAGQKCLDLARRLMLKWLDDPEVFKNENLDAFLLGCERSGQPFPQPS